MFFYAGCRCPVCGQLFTENDDIVACPQCGAPHHRSCWQQEGHCHFADRHKDGFRWEREDAPAPTESEEDDEYGDEEDSTSGSYRDTAERERRCPRCGFPHPPEALFCSRCGLPLSSGSYQQTGYGEYAPFRAVPINPCGGVDPKEEIEGVPAEELAACVQVNTAYYLPRFSVMARGSRVSWNWAAFFCGPYWLLFRKAYLPGGLIWGALALLRTLFTVVTCKNILPFLGEATTNAEQMTRYMQILSDGTVSDKVILLLNLLLFLQFMVHLLCGLFGNRLYMRTTVRRVRRLREQGGEGTNRILLSGSGGVSLLLGLLAYSMLSMLQTMVTFLVR